MFNLRIIFITLTLFGAQTHAATPAASPDTVLILGDSLSSAHRIPAEAGWVALLQQRLTTEGKTAPVIINASRGGKTLDDGIAELPALLEQHHPDIVVIELGGNDAIFGAQADKLEHGLASLIALAQASGAKVTILGFEIPPAFDKDNATGILRAAYAKTAQDNNVSLLPSLLAGISDNPALLLDDGIHPNAAAQVRVLDNAWPTLRPLLLP